MKIALVISTFPPHIGGMGQVAADEARLLAERGFEVTVFTLAYPKTVYADSVLPYKVVRLRPTVIMGDAGFTPQLINLLCGFDLVHVHYPGYGMVEMVLLAHQLHGVKYMVTYHMDARPVGIMAKALKKIVDAVWQRMLLKSALKIITPDREYYEQETGRKDAIEIYNGVDVNLFTPATDTEVPENHKGILFVGNLMPVKRLDLLLRALPLLSDKTVRLTVAGGGYEMKKYQTLAKELGIDERVNWLDKISVSELPDVFRHATVVAIPSERESFSLVAIMAMACGKPAVVADVVGLRGRITDGVDGYWFKSGDVSDLVIKLEQVLSLSSAERGKIGMSGRSKVLEQYTLTNHGEKIEKIIRQLV